MSRSMLLLVSFLAHGALAGKVGVAPLEVTRALGMAEATLADKMEEATQEKAKLDKLKADAKKAKTEAEANAKKQRAAEDAAVKQIDTATQAAKAAEDADNKANKATEALTNAVKAKQEAEAKAQVADAKYTAAQRDLADAENKYEEQLAKELGEKQAAEAVLENAKKLTDQKSVEAVSAGTLKEAIMDEVRKKEVELEKAVAEKDEASKQREFARQEEEVAREAAFDKSEELKATNLALEALSKRKEKMDALEEAVDDMFSEVDTLKKDMTKKKMAEPGNKDRNQWEVLKEQKDKLTATFKAYNKVSKMLTDLQQNDAESYKVIWEGDAVAQVDKDWTAALTMACDMKKALAKQTPKLDPAKECGTDLWAAVQLVKEPLPGAPLAR
eukprot:TRINITY_DN61725_c0_g1_i1.p1 TRINITY_DN61725_c0_g1~~TRINITY_DN61725_c0_g1_i1.p1  ORF type:complete len:387 (+),score=116.80 TRINITY_DN61725_c0_g1_i1:83-1243(+)